MRDDPPHLLLTNYAMLEYLLLRPADMELFEGKHGGHWRFVVLDEAHVYDGAKAEEVGMLLRRLRERVGRGQDNAAFQAIATSATVGGHPRAVIDFAAKLFDLPFEWVDGDPARQDLVGAQRVDIPAGPLWGPLGPAGYLALAAAADPAAELPGRAAHDPVAAGLGASSAGSGDAALLLAHEQAMARLRILLAAAPRPFTELAAEVFTGTDGPRAEAALAALVSAGAKIRDGTGSPVLSARYHLFARATEGAFTCLATGRPHVSLARHEICPDCSGAVFEFGCCKRCGAVHLAGSVERVAGGERFTSRAVRPDRRTWLLLDAPAEAADEDDEILEQAATATARDAVLCGRCGALHMVATATGATATGAAPCGCPAAGLRLVRRLAAASGTPNGCLACGARGTGMVRLLESGNEAAAAVLATALYQALPPDEELADRPGGGRKLLTFSDSRQAAAFFAPYLESSHALVRQRRLILDGLARATARDAEATVDDLIEETAAAAGRRRGVLPPGVATGPPPGGGPLGAARAGRPRRAPVPGRPRAAAGRAGRRPVVAAARPAARSRPVRAGVRAAAHRTAPHGAAAGRAHHAGGGRPGRRDVRPAARPDLRPRRRRRGQAQGAQLAAHPRRQQAARLPAPPAGRRRRARVRHGRARRAGRLLAGAVRGTGRLAARHGPAQAGPGASGRSHLAHAFARRQRPMAVLAVPAGHHGRAARRVPDPGLRRRAGRRPAPTTTATTAPCTGRPRRSRWSPASTPRSGPAWRPPTSSSGSWPARSTC